MASLGGNESSRMHPSEPERTRQGLDKRVSARLSWRVAVCTDRDLIFVAIRNCPTCKM